MNEKINVLELVKKERCAVVGIGVSNRPLIDFLLSHGAEVTAYDKKEKEDLGGIAVELEARGVRLVCGDNYLDGIGEKIIFRSPGIRPDHPAFTHAVKNGAILTSEMELFFALCPTMLYAITGSDGKTTTTTLTHIFLSEEKKRSDPSAHAYLGGNIGAPLLPNVEEMTEKDVSVLELSSFQLMASDCAPHAAAITNITPNHLNWHIDMDEYVKAKRTIVGARTKRVVLNADNEITSSLDFGEDIEYICFSSRRTGYGNVVPKKRNNAKAVFIKGGVICISDGNNEKEILSVADIKLPGIHNVENYMTAIALTYGDVDPDIYCRVAKEFGGVEHRLELVCETKGVKYYNSSIDSSPTRTAAALSALKEKPIVICGGSDKNLDYAPLARVLCERAKAVVLNGDSAVKIKAALEAYPKTRECSLAVYEAKTLGEATELAIKVAQNGDTVLLSPASASFDQFENFMERGRFFKRIVLSKKDEN